ncbi:aldolase/citrate lyase family protein [Streptomyces malaysiensis]|uniref:aldolase/citrate lyase family protein n=1 Tax=Streptomyces malaysiensis TaxID=92644 RepID=UPI00202F21C0|nr:aldolase/citrate lyase family protein [Streptomyces malaysiensis]
MKLEADSLGHARSLLFVPGDRADLFDLAVRSGADAVVIDLEDAVAQDRKTAAREAARAWLDRACALPSGDRVGSGRPARPCRRGDHRHTRSVQGPYRQSACETPGSDREAVCPSTPDASGQRRDDADGHGDRMGP